MYPPKIPEGVTIFTALPEESVTSSPVVCMEYFDEVGQTIYGAKFATVRKELLQVTDRRIMEYGILVVADHIAIELGPAYEEIEKFRDDVKRWAGADNSIFERLN